LPLEENVMKAEFDPLFGALLPGQWFPSPAHIMRRAAILDMFSGNKPGSLLEMGCGAGRMLADWHQLGHRGDAVDLDATARKLAAECVDALDLNFAVGDHAKAGAQYDYLVATEVLEHVEDPGAVIKQWSASLKDDGIFLATVPAFRHLWGKSDEWAGHVQRFEPADFRRIVEEAGFDVIEMRLYGYPVGQVMRVLGNVTSGMKMKADSKDRDAATFASGHDRSVENKLAPLMRSFVGRAALKVANSLQRQFPNSGHGLILIARKKRQAGEQGELACAA
jgi:SAM-dependent methyltransferase